MNHSKILVALKGPADVGKTTTLKKVYDSLVSTYSVTIISPLKVIGNDISVIVEIYGIKIGIESMGDPSRHLKERLQKLVDAGCDRIICATRTWGATVDAVNSFSEQFEIIWSELGHEDDLAVLERIETFLASEIIDILKLPKAEQDAAANP